MIGSFDVPTLPDEIPLPKPAATDDPPATLRLEPAYRPVSLFPWPLYMLPQGAYFLQLQPNAFGRYNGTMRVERHSAGVTASGDLYNHPPFKVVTFPFFQIVPNPDPSPSAGIPVYARSSYRYYLRVTQILEYLSFSDTFTLGFELYQYDAASQSWTNQGAHTAAMTFKPAPAGYPSGATYLEGTAKNAAGADVGALRMGWVSPHLRKATLEIDRVNASEFPGSSGTGIDWQSVFASVNWDVNVYESDTNLTEPSGESWSDAEMHSAMLARRDAANLDTEWRYHLLCVRRLDSTSRGIMYDAYAGDSNNIPREGAGIASHWTIPNQEPWGTVKGLRVGTAPAPYFRTAVHEIGHAFGLYHNTADNGFMNTTDVIAASPGTFPANIQWSWNGEDAKRLRHMPDPWVRPGMIPFGQPYGNAPVSPTDMLDLAGPLELRVEPLLASVPLGAPVRVKLTLTNRSEADIEVPHSLSLKDEHVSGAVRGPSDKPRSFRSILRCVEEHQGQVLKAGRSISEDMTLLRGHEGALFPDSGLHVIDVDVVWTTGGVGVRVSGSASVLITPPLTASHADAAQKTLTEPDLLLTLAIGGDHIEEGNAALAAAMRDETLAPHFAAIAAKRAGRRFGKRRADPGKALEALGEHPVVSAAEARSVAEIIKEAGGPALKKAGKELSATLREAADGDRVVKGVADAMQG